ncbi:unnamed protein product [Knipowitschia caucasica]
MIPLGDSLLKYDTPVLISHSSGTSRSPKGRSFRVSPEQSLDATPVPPPKPKTVPLEQQHEEILNAILPPREWTEGTDVWLQKVSSVPGTRKDVLKLGEHLDSLLEKRQARLHGICPVRRELFSQCFDELIRQATVSCAEQGLLLGRVRDEINMTLATYRSIYESSMAFGMRKVLQAERSQDDTHTRVAELEREKLDLVKQLNEEKAKCEAVEKKETERRKVEERKHAEEIQDLKRRNEQLKTQLKGIVTAKQ